MHVKYFYIFIGLLLFSSFAQAVWFDKSWAYRQQILIGASHQRLDGNYTYNIDFNSQGLISAGKMQTDCDDIRLTYNHLTALDINVLNCNTGDTNVLFKSQFELTDGLSDLTSYQLYYGNPIATKYANDLNKVFMWYDDFDDNSFNWPNQDSADITETNGVLNIRADGIADVSGANFPLWIDANTFIEYRAATNTIDEGGYLGIADSNLTILAPLFGNNILHQYVGFSGSPGTDLYANATLISNAVGTYSANTYSLVKVDLNSTRSSFWINDNNILNQSTTRPNVVTAHPFLDVFCSGACAVARVDLNIDWIKVQHYAIFNPVITFGAESIFTGYFKFQFFDENFGNGVIPTTLKINNVDYSNSVDSNGLLAIDFNVSFSTNVYSIIAGRTNYGTRRWDVDLNVASEIDYNFAMLQSIKGQDINFQWYDWNITALPSTRVFVGAPQSNNVSGLRRNFFSGICETDSDSKCAFYLNGNDFNYSFRALQDNNTAWDYNYTRVSVKIPKDERTLVSLSPFRVDVGIIGARTFTAQVADVNTNILPNTLDYYDFKIDMNTLYLPKHFFTRSQGNPIDYIIQPYLVDSTYGISSKFFVIDVATQQTIPNVEIITRKTIPAVAGSNLILMEDVISDGSGTTNASFITGDTYQAKFYFNRALIFTGTITANSTTYYARLDFGSGIQQPSYSPLDVNFVPLNNFVEADSNGILSLTQQVFGAYSLLNISIINNAVEVVDLNYSTGSQFTENINSNSLNLNYPVEITYTIWQGGTPRQFNKSYNVVGINSNQYTLVGDLQAMKAEVLGDFGAILLAIILAIAAVAMAASYVGFDTNFLAIIGFLILGFFTFIGWIPVLWFGVAALMGFGAMILKARL